MSEIEFVGALPGSTNVGNTRMHRKRMSEFAVALRDRPGEWAIYPYPSTEVSARAAASRISRGTWMHLTDTGTVDGARC